MLVPLAFKAILSKNGHVVPALLIITILVAELTAVGAIANAYMDKVVKTVEYVGLNLRSNFILITSSGEFMDYSTLEGVPLNADVAIISPELLINSIVTLGNKSVEARIRCVEPEVFSKVAGIEVKGLNDDYVVYIGRALADALNLSQGRTVWFTSENEPLRFSVKGVFKTQTPLDGEVLMGLEKAWMLRPKLKGKISLIRILVKKPYDYVGFENFEVKGLKVLCGSGLRSALNDLAEQTYRLIDVWRVIICVLILTTAYVLGLRLIEESKWECTLLRALGLSKNSVVKLIVYELLLICILGLTLGLALGVSGVYVACMLLKIVGLLEAGVRPLYTVELILKTSAYVIASTTFGGFVAVAKILKKPIALYVR